MRIIPDIQNELWCNSVTQIMTYGSNFEIQIMTYGSNSVIQIMGYGHYLYL
jgi:hypothetical protein